MNVWCVEMRGHPPACPMPRPHHGQTPVRLQLQPTPSLLLGPDLAILTSAVLSVKQAAQGAGFAACSVAGWGRAG